MQRACVQLEHEHVSGNDPCLVFSNGNDEPHRGFGHLAFLTADVYQASEELEKAGVSFKKKPGECGCCSHISAQMFVETKQSVSLRTQGDSGSGPPTQSHRLAHFPFLRAKQGPRITQYA